jgi:hypothetical protein
VSDGVSATKRLLVVLVVLTGLASIEKSIAATPAPVPAPTFSAPLGPPMPATAALTPGAALMQDEKLRADLVSATAKLSSLEGAISKSGERADRAAERSFWIALAAIGASLLAQLLLMWHQRVINRDQAQAEVSNSYVEWQLKQLSELYGPLRALLGQSNAMYRQMNRALAAAKPDVFRMMKVKGADFDDEEFQICKDGVWIRFRTVKHLGEVYNNGCGIEPYFDDVVAVGSRMVDLIRDKAGYARPDDRDIVAVMGSYLAHFAVLSRLHQRAKDGQPILTNKADEEATFPIEIQNVVNRGFDAINGEIMDWRKRGRSK